MEPQTYNLPYLHRGDSWSGFGPFQILVASGEPFTAVAEGDSDTLTAAGRGLSNGDILTVATTAAGLTAGRRLYVVDATTNTFGLALEAGGEAIVAAADRTHTLQLHAPPASAIDRIWIEFRRDSETGPIGLALDSDDASITILDADEWRFTIPAQDGPSTAGEWHYDIEILDADEVRKTYVKGLLVVGQDVTRNTAAA